jgi:hypothetical protein
MPSAGTGTFVRKLAIGLVAAFIDAFQAFRDHCLQFPDLALLLGVFRIHQLCCCDVSFDATDDGRRTTMSPSLTASLSETPTA